MNSLHAKLLFLTLFKFIMKIILFGMEMRGGGKTARSFKKRQFQGRLYLKQIKGNSLSPPPSRSLSNPPPSSSDLGFTRVCIGNQVSASPFSTTPLPNSPPSLLSFLSSYFYCLFLFRYILLRNNMYLRFINTYS